MSEQIVDAIEEVVEEVVDTSNPNNIFIAYAAIITMALIPIWIGSHRSLSSKFGADTMTSKDAYMFPVIGSCVLFGLYMLFKMFSKDYINMLLTAYFLLFGIGAVTTTAIPVFRRISKPAKSTKPWEFSVHLPWDAEPTQVTFYAIDLVALAFALAIGAWYVATKHWIANNVLGLSFSISGITYMSVGQYKVGATLLTGLFFYDIFWVFGTDVMVTVAKSFDAPIKLLFPRDVFAAEYKHTMLGLGDIVLPGVFIALLLRFDRHMAAGGKDADTVTTFAKTYFSATFYAYIAGLLTTIGIMHFFKAAQPALLYLVPACVLTSLFLAYQRKETKELFEYNEEEVKEDEGEESEKKND